MMSNELTSLPISRRYLHDEVAEKIRELIHLGELPPGGRIEELVLTKKFGISRTPLREAIKILSSEGLLELLPNRGARVVVRTMRELSEIVFLLQSLEQSVYNVLSQPFKRAFLHSLVAKVEKIAHDIVDLDNEQLLLILFELRIAVLHSCDNSVIVNVYDHYQKKIALNTIITLKRLGIDPYTKSSLMKAFIQSFIEAIINYDHELVLKHFRQFVTCSKEGLSLHFLDQNETERSLA